VYSPEIHGSGTAGSRNAPTYCRFDACSSGSLLGWTALLETVTVTAAEVAVLPAASHAWTVSVCVPLLLLVVSQESPYGLAVSLAPRATPSR
jgi:hypothetical protein